MEMENESQVDVNWGPSKHNFRRPTACDTTPTLLKWANPGLFLIFLPLAFSSPGSAGFESGPQDLQAPSSRSSRGPTATRRTSSTATSSP